jgi:hypothetical protein
MMFYVEDLTYLAKVYSPECVEWEFSEVRV